MTPALYLITLTAGLVAGWQVATLKTERRIRRLNHLEIILAAEQWQDLAAGNIGGWHQQQGNREISGPDHSPGPEIDLRDPPLYDWRTDPVIAGCPACHNTGRIPLMSGHLVRCPCGTKPLFCSPADKLSVDGPTPPASIVATAGEQNSRTA